MFIFDPTMMQDGGQDRHLNHDLREKRPLIQKAYLNVYLSRIMKNQQRDFRTGQTQNELYKH